MSMLDFASETGPLEIGEIVLLALSGLIFLAVAIRTRRPGAPLFALLALVFSVAALREFDTDAVDPLGLYLTGHAARWHLATLMLLPVLVIAWRDRAVPPIDHVRATWRLGCLLVGASVFVGLAGLLERKTKNLADGHWIADYAVLVEELLEVAAYGLALLLAVKVWRGLSNDPGDRLDALSKPAPRPAS